MSKKYSEAEDYRRMLSERDDKIAMLEGEKKALQGLVDSLTYQLNIIRAVLAWPPSKDRP